MSVVLGNSWVWFLSSSLPSIGKFQFLRSLVHVCGILCTKICSLSCQRDVFLSIFIIIWVVPSSVLISSVSSSMLYVSWSEGIQLQMSIEVMSFCGKRFIQYFSWVTLSSLMRLIQYRSLRCGEQVNYLLLHNTQRSSVWFYLPSASWTLWSQICEFTKNAYKIPVNAATVPEIQLELHLGMLALFSLIASSVGVAYLCIQGHKKG